MALRVIRTSDLGDSEYLGREERGVQMGSQGPAWVAGGTVVHLLSWRTQERSKGPVGDPLS